MATVVTTTVTAISDVTVTAVGNVTNEGGASVTARGICWALTSTPTITNNIVANGSGLGSYTCNITGLTSGTIYYARAYATSIAGTAYGSQFTFTTLALPTILTSSVTNIAGKSAISGFTLTSRGYTTVTSAGLCYNTSSNPTIGNSVTQIITNYNGGTPLNYGGGSTISNTLTPNTTYYVRAYATNVLGTSYGNTFTFTTTDYPSVTTTSISNITSCSANVFGSLTSTGGDPSSTSYGFCVSSSPNPTVNLGVNSSTSPVSSYSFNANYGYNPYEQFQPGTLYYVRAYAQNSAGTVYGNQLTFTTTAVIAPIVNTGTVSLISNGTGAFINTNTLSFTGVTSSCATSVTVGVCYHTSPSPTISNSVTVTSAVTNTTTYNRNITGLIPNTTYYARAYATNSFTTTYGAELSFTTLNYATVVTNTVSNITGSSALADGSVTNDGGSSVSQRGFCWSTLPNPTTANSYTASGSGLGTFTSSINSLTANTVYYIRAYAINSVGTAYGNQITFTTAAPAVPTLTTFPVKNIERYNASTTFSLLEYISQPNNRKQQSF
jgi:hypothetical protein